MRVPGLLHSLLRVSQGSARVILNGVHRRPEVSEAGVHRVHHLLPAAGAYAVLIQPEREGEQPVNLGERPERADRQPILAGRPQLSESPSGVRVVEMAGEKSGTATRDTTSSFASLTSAPH